MTKLLLGILGIALILGGVAYMLSHPVKKPESGVENGTSEKKYESTKYELSFFYPSIYELTEHDQPGSALRARHTITLIPKVDLPAPQDSEGPPSITIDIIQNNLDKQTTEKWIRGSSASNFKLSTEGTLTPISVDNAPALSYRWSGLYDGTTIAIARPNWVYAFSVTYLEPGADIVQDFVALRGSIRFLSATGNKQK